ncbi:MAG: hypothetical protein V3W41_05575 [Planctomycetota bacterium]
MYAENHRSCVEHAQKRWHVIKSRGREPQVFDLHDGPLAGATYVLSRQPYDGEKFGWVYRTDRGIVVANYRADGKSWRFENFRAPGNPI